ncbi:hypothetical protein TIFTF001_011616 [Ficus carica]|uniref:Uncharacterized protein n=1 Tax=Ficus carica TaxID=3494 RepID=A0AA87ZYL3_FICCA|nr:hypothetical protein TIFTF001_011616 [Ficus carica]
MAMTTLQRSSVSFRRQGSSGRIWGDRLQVQASDSKASHSSFRLNKRVEGPLTNLQRKQEGNFHQPKKVSSSRRSNGDQKVRKCSFSALFGQCMGSPTA